MTPAAITGNIVKGDEALACADAILCCGRRVVLISPKIVVSRHEIGQPPHVDLNAFSSERAFLNSVRRWHDIEAGLNESHADADCAGVAVIGIAEKLVPTDFREQIPLAHMIGA